MAEDFLHVLELVDKSRREHHRDCDVICLGTYLKNFNFQRNSRMVSMLYRMDRSIFDLGGQVLYRYIYTGKKVVIGIEGFLVSLFFGVVFFSLSCRVLTFAHDRNSPGFFFFFSFIFLPSPPPPPLSYRPSTKLAHSVLALFFSRFSAASPAPPPPLFSRFCNRVIDRVCRKKNKLLVA